MKDTGSAVNLIGKGTSIEGTITTDSSIVIHGRIKGDVICQNTITVGTDGYIEGNIKAKNAIIGGQISGTVAIEEKIVLESKSSLTGELKTGRLVIDEGAVFAGKSMMGDQKNKTVPVKSEAAGSPESE